MESDTAELFGGKFGRPSVSLGKKRPKTNESDSEEPVVKKRKQGSEKAAASSKELPEVFCRVCVPLMGVCPTCSLLGLQMVSVGEDSRVGL
jgi:hypothetical protein